MAIQSLTKSRIFIVRPMNEKDAPEVAEIWRRGLKQTAESYGFQLVRLPMSYALEWYGENAMKPDGDVGPCGRNLVEAWMSKNDRTMFVACDDSENKSVVGCIGVKVGKDLGKRERGSTVASVWRMSVAETYRRQGVGILLMNAAEEWALQHQCTIMILETTNKIAAQFYKQKAGYREDSFPKERSWIHHYMGIVKIYTKSLEVKEDTGECDEVA